MNEIANCPRCGKPPRTQDSDPGYYNLKTYYCCGHAVYADDEKPWNQYAAAMELARMEYALEHCESKHEHQYQFHVEEARKRVLEVFGGE